MDYLSEISLVYKVFDSGQTELIQSETRKHLNLVDLKRTEMNLSGLSFPAEIVPTVVVGQCSPFRRRLRKIHQYISNLRLWCLLLS